MRRLAQHRLIWLLLPHNLIPVELSAFRKGTHTVSVISDSATDLEDAKSGGGTVHVAFHSVTCVFYSLPHATIMGQLRASKVVERI